MKMGSAKLSFCNECILDAADGCMDGGFNTNFKLERVCNIERKCKATNLSGKSGQIGLGDTDTGGCSSQQVTDKFSNAGPNEMPA